ncbi:efflux RND transporter periplasmic adaptor subunit [Kitasatospora mediocidica]|uniref:efflux RND transporter periplasmic adaptor subunit n=1 Tax=Kitasatospora mediocidica TaxID=58352 RepID=UPI00068BC757|nr:biotin/lipoyl-binding protein [Kitasatospora mediocidica]
MKVLPRRRGAVLVNSVLGVALLAGGALAYTTVTSGSSAAASKPTTRSATVTKGTVLATVSGSGALSSPSDAGQNFVTGGKLTAVKVSVGDTVTAGEVLATVDMTQAQQQLTTAQGGVTSAQAALNTAEANLTKAQAGVTTTTTKPVSGGTVQSSFVTANATGAPTAPGSTSRSGGSGSGSGSVGGGTVTGNTANATGGNGAGSATNSGGGGNTAPAPQTTTITTTTVDPDAVAQAEQQVTQAQQQLSAAQITLTNAQAGLAGTTLTASEGGTVASISNKVGDTVSGTGTGDSSGSGSSGSGASSSSKTTGSSTSSAPSGFIVLTNPTGMQVTADFSELDSLKLKKGEAATVTLNAQSSTVLNATVLSVSSLPVSSSTGASAAVQYAATLQINGDTSTLRTGLSATVSVVTGEADNALSVPAAALAGTGTTRTATLVKPDGTTSRVSVTVGVVGDSTVQVVSGLNVGDKLQIASATAGSGSGFPSGAFPGGAGVAGFGGGAGGGGGRAGGGGSARGGN